MKCKLVWKCNQMQIGCGSKCIGQLAAGIWGEIKQLTNPLHLPLAAACAFKYFLVLPKLATFLDPRTIGIVHVVIPLLKGT